MGMLTQPAFATPFISSRIFRRVVKLMGNRFEFSVETFYTSDYDLSRFNSNMEGLNLRFNSPDGMLGIHHLNTLELRFAHYNRSTGLSANVVTLAASLK